MINENTRMTQMLRDQGIVVRRTAKGVETQILTHYAKYASQLKTLEELAQVIRGSRTLLFSVVRSTTDGQQIQFHVTPTGSRLLDCFDMDFAQIRLEFPQHEFNPLIRVMLDQLEGIRPLLPYRHLAKSGWFNRRCEPGLLQHVKQLNALVAAIHDELRRPGVSHTLRNFERNAKARCKELQTYCRSWLRERKRLCVVRVDLHYQDIEDGQTTTITSKQAADDQERFRAMVCQRKPGTLFEHLVGFAWKREYGLVAGHHTHWLCLFDGSKVQYDECKAEQFGQAWVEFLGGHGWYYNCNRSKGSYQACGIGNVRHGDVNMEHGLDLAVAYLTKVDYYVRLLDDGKRRAFGKGGWPDAMKPWKKQRLSRKPQKRKKVRPLLGKARRGK